MAKTPRHASSAGAMAVFLFVLLLALWVASAYVEARGGLLP